MYTVSGKRILRHKVSESRAANKILRRNIAPGAYLFSIIGKDGSAVTSRVTHGGGNMDIDIAFGNGGEERFSARQLAKGAGIPSSWRINVKAEGYADTMYWFVPVVGTNPRQNITLRESGTNPNINYGTLTYGGQTYKTVRIGRQTWMAENMNLGEVVGSVCYANNIYACSDYNYYSCCAPAMCYYGNSDNCVKYGRLYSWLDANIVCPSGWKLPSRQDWDDLVMYAGGKDAMSLVLHDSGYAAAGRVLKSKSGWSSGGWTPSDYFGFSALPGGLRDHQLGDFSYESHRGFWWTSSNCGGDNQACYVSMSTSDSVLIGYITKRENFSVRCIKND